MPTEPFVVNLGASNRSPVRGCPGVPKTCPRVESVLEIRTKDGSSFAIKSIILELNTVQSVSVPATGGLSSNDACRTYNVYKDTIYHAPQGQGERILGMDLPFIIPLGKDIISSGKNSRWNAKTIHNLTVRIGWTSSKVEVFTISFPLIIKRYDTLPLYRQFNEPITKTIDSPDRNILVEYSLPSTSVGPKDELVIYMKISPNSNFLNNSLIDNTASKRLSFMKRKPPVFKLKRINFELREILVCHEGGLGSKQTKLLSKQQEFDAELGSDGITTQISFDLPSEIKNIISSSSSNALTSASQLKKLPLSSLGNNLNSNGGNKGYFDGANTNINTNNCTSNSVFPSDRKSKSTYNGHNIDGYKPHLTKKLTGGLLTNKRKSLDTKNLDLRNQLNDNSLSSTSSAENHTLEALANSRNNSFDTSLDFDLIDIKPVPTIQSIGLNNNHKTLTTNTKLLEEVNTGVPLSHMQGFTTNGKLFSIKYELIFKVKVTNSQLIKFSQPIIVSPYDRIQSVKLLKWIVKEWDMAQFINNTTFQTAFNNEKVSYINSFTTSLNSSSSSTIDDDDDELEAELHKNSGNHHRVIDDEYFRASVNLNVSKGSKFKNNFFNVSQAISKQNKFSGDESANNYYYDYSTGTMRNPEFEKTIRKYYNNSGDYNGSEDGGNPYASTIYQSKPSHIYRPQNQMDWKLLGLSEKALGSYGKSIIHYID